MKANLPKVIRVQRIRPGRSDKLIGVQQRGRAVSTCCKTVTARVRMNLNKSPTVTLSLAV